jgi:beta-glucanase (GH16 family)
MRFSVFLRTAVLVSLLPLSLHAQQWKLVWADSFDTYTGLPDTSKWSWQVGDNGWGNNEKEYYSDKRLENTRVENGNLIIEAHRDFWLNHEYTSGRIRTVNKGDWLYGRFEVRAKLPYGGGTWPAIWMMPTDNAYGGWPKSGEIDIMEHVGNDPGVIHFSAHSLKYYWRIGTEKTATTIQNDFADAFHVYTMEWSPDSIRGYLDQRKYFTATNEHSDWQAWPFDKRFHFILNIALGGDWGGVIDNNIFPQRMTIDYVKAYTWDNTSHVLRSRTPEQPGYGACTIVQRNGSLLITLPAHGRYAVTLCALNGTTIASAQGSGSTCSLARLSAVSGAYVLKASGSWGVATRNILYRE